MVHDWRRGRDLEGETGRDRQRCQDSRQPLERVSIHAFHLVEQSKAEIVNKKLPSSQLPRFSSTGFFLLIFKEVTAQLWSMAHQLLTDAWSRREEVLCSLEDGNRPRIKDIKTLLCYHCLPHQEREFLPECK